jgi:hypothetical protein
MQAAPQEDSREGETERTGGRNNSGKARNAAGVLSWLASGLISFFE